MIYGSNQSIFDEGFIDSTLKNPNLFTEAMIFAEMSTRPTKVIESFCNSGEAKDMVNCGILTHDTLQRLAAQAKTDRCRDVAACHLAKEADDPLWNELIDARRKEREIMNELIMKYGNPATDVSNKIRDEIISKKIPTRFIINEE